MANKKKKIPGQRTPHRTHVHDEKDRRGPFTVKGVTKDITYYNLYCSVCGKFQRRDIKK